MASTYFKCHQTERLKKINEYLENGLTTLKSSKSQTPTHLQGISFIRCGIRLALEVLIPFQITATSESMIAADEQLQYMLSVLKQVCTEKSLNDNVHTGPIWYILKYIASHWGASITQQVAQNESCAWMIPTSDLVTLVNKVG